VLKIIAFPTRYNGLSAIDKRISGLVINKKYLNTATMLSFVCGVGFFFFQRASFVRRGKKHGDRPIALEPYRTQPADTETSLAELLKHHQLFRAADVMMLPWDTASPPHNTNPSSCSGSFIWLLVHKRSIEVYIKQNKFATTYALIQNSWMRLQTETLISCRFQLQPYTNVAYFTDKSTV
jgi:hypothetical protein